MMRCTTTAGALIGALMLVSAGCGGTEAGAAASGLGAAAGGPATQDAYAPKLPVPEEVPADLAAGAFAVQLLKNAKVPSRSEVGIPPYPGARIMSTMGATAATVNDQQTEMLPALAMLSTDPLADVLAFYQRELADWQYKEFFGSHMFWDGPPDADPMDITAPHPGVTIMEVGEGDDLVILWPGVKTRIDIRYDPAGG